MSVGSGKEVDAIMALVVALYIRMTRVSRPSYACISGISVR